MTITIYAYRKAANAYTDIVMVLPDNAGHDDEHRATELATIDGITYVAVPGALTLPEQPPEIDPQPVTLTPELRERIKAESVHCQWIAQRLIDRIRARYTVDDEAYFTRILLGKLAGTYTMLPGEPERIAQYQRDTEEARAWAKAERAKLGL